MDAQSDEDVRGVVEEMAKDRGRTMRKRSQQSGNGFLTAQGIRTLLGAGIILVLFLTVIFLIAGGGEKGYTEELSAINERLDLIEMRLERVDQDLAGIREAAGKTEGLREAVAALERDRRSTLTRIDKLSNLVEDLNKGGPSAPASTAASSSGTKIHRVVKGDTLFSIAKRYDLSVDDLRRLNSIGKNAVIQPGQELQVK